MKLIQSSLSMLLRDDEIWYNNTESTGHKKGTCADGLALKTGMYFQFLSN
jgi:hypothetical protein